MGMRLKKAAKSKILMADSRRSGIRVPTGDSQSTPVSRWARKNVRKRPRVALLRRQRMLSFGWRVPILRRASQPKGETMSKKFIIAWIVIFVVWFLGSFVIHGVL